MPNQGWHLPGTACPALQPWWCCSGMGLEPLGTALGVPEPQLPFAKDSPLPGAAVSRGRLCSRPSPPGKGLCQTYMKKRIKPGSSITPDLWLYQPGKVGGIFLFLIPHSTPSPGLLCRAGDPCPAAGTASPTDPSPGPAVPDTPKPEQGA